MTKREILIQTRNEWDARNAEQNRKYEAQYAEFNRVQSEIFDNIKVQISDALSRVNLNLEINVDTNFGKNVRVYVKSNDNRIHAEDKALSWTYEVSLNENGTADKKTSSWSGLQATTDEQIESLYQTADALYLLNNMDWTALLTVTLPKWSDYITEKSSIGQRPDFEADIRAAEIAALIGANKLIKGSTPSGKGRRGHSTVWFLIVSETPKQFKIVEIANYSIQEQYLQERGQTLAEVVEQAKNWTSSITKEKFLNDILDREIETLEF